MVEIPNHPGEFPDPLANYDPPKYRDRLEQALAERKVSEIRAQPFISVTSDTTIRRALEILAGLEIACLLVEDDGNLVGVFSVRDVLNRVATNLDEIRDRPVSDVMSGEPLYLYESDSAGSALCVMAVKGFRHAPVLDLQDRIVGIVSPERVASFLSKHLTE